MKTRSSTRFVDSVLRAGERGEIAGAALTAQGAVEPREARKDLKINPFPGALEKEERATWKNWTRIAQFIQQK